MAVDVTPGIGKTVAADVIGAAHAPATGEQIQYVKIDMGAAGASTPVVAGQAPAAACLPVVLPVAGYTSQPTVTRPANTTAYAAGDVVGGAITFTSAGPSGGHLLVTDADLRIDLTAVPSGMTTFRLHLYDVTPPSAIADNAAWDLPSGDRSAYLGWIDFDAPTDLGSTLFTQRTAVNKKVKLNASTSLFGYLVTAGGFTPAANSEVYAPRLGGTGL